MRLNVFALLLTFVNFIYASVHSTCKQPGQVMLSFDGCPSANTAGLLTTLSRNVAPALIHVSVDSLYNTTLAEYIRVAHNDGHQIGIFVPESLMNEAYSSGSAELPVIDADLFGYLAKAINMLTALLETGKPPKYVRFGRRSNTGNTVQQVNPLHVPLSFRKTCETLGLTITKPKMP